MNNTSLLRIAATAGTQLVKTFIFIVIINNILKILFDIIDIHLSKLPVQSLDH
jgi:hypothetical protein